MDLLLRRNQAFSYDDGTDALIDRSITKANIQSATIGDYAFDGCANLESINAPNCTTINSYAFRNNSLLKYVNFPNLNIVKNYAFEGCISLEDFDFSNLTTVATYSFCKCSKIESVCLTSATSVGEACFRGSGVKTLVLPVAKYAVNRLTNPVGTSSGYSASKLECLDLGETVTNFSTNALRNNTLLTTIVLRCTSRNGIWGGTGVFTDTPFASGGAGGTIYIPKALYDHLGDGSSSDYLANTNWATINGYGTITWASIEGSQYEHYYADGTPIPSS